LYGVSERVGVGLIPRFGFNDPSDGRDSSKVGIGDLTLQAQYGLTRFEEGSWIPMTAFVFQETLPTGKYDRLGDRAADGLGAGAYSSTLEYERDCSTHVVGSSPQRTELNSSPAHTWSLAPAIEYNFNSRVGIIVGAKLTTAGRNATAVVVPVAAVNIVI
jgi:hypothetical protein